MTITQNAIACEVCTAPLTGGRDTYGSREEKLCFSCYMERASQPDSKMKQLEIAVAEAKSDLEEAENDLDEAEADLREAMGRIRRCEDATQQAIDKLTGETP